MSILIKTVNLKDPSIWKGLIHAYTDFYQTELTQDGLERVRGWIHDDKNYFWSGLA